MAVSLPLALLAIADSPAIAEAPKRWALIVVISQYEHQDVDPLNYAHSDAISFAQHLQSEKGGAYTDAELRLLTNRRANWNELESELKRIASGASEGDIVILYFAGHGVKNSAQSCPKDELGEIPSDCPENTYFLLYDTDPNDLAHTALSVREIQNFVGDVKANKVLLVADACRSGNFATRAGVKGKNASTRYFKEMTKQYDGKVAVTSGQAFETSREGEAWGGGHGVFTYYLMRAVGIDAGCAIKRGGNLSMEDAFSYASLLVQFDTDRDQTPQRGGDLRFFPIAFDIERATGAERARCELFRKRGFVMHRAEEEALAAAKAYANAISTCTEDELTAFLTRFPNSSHAATALEILQRLRSTGTCTPPASPPFTPVERYHRLRWETKARRSPDFSSSVDAMLVADQRVYVVAIQSDGDWAMVEFEDGTIAFVAKSNLREEGEDEQKHTSIQAPMHAVPPAPVTWVGSEAIKSLDPMSVAPGDTRKLLGQIYEGLTTVGGGPRLAVSWFVSEDGLEFTFNIRNARFHDGSHLRAVDVQYSLRRAKSSIGLRHLLAAVEKIDAKDDDQVRLLLSEPDPFLPRALSQIPIMSQEWAELQGVGEFAENLDQPRLATANGTGPFALDFFDKDDTKGVLLRRFAGYWNARHVEGDIERLVYVSSDSPGGRRLAVETGDAEVASNVALSDSSLATDVPMEIVETSEPSMVFLAVANPTFPRSEENPLSYQRVRQALRIAIDAEAIADRTLEYPHETNYSVSEVYRRFFENQDLKTEDAMRLLEEAGFEEGLEASLSCQTGTKFDKSWHQICASVADQLEDVGMVVSVAYDVTADPTKPVSQARRNQDLYLVEVSSLSASGDEFLASVYHSPTPSGHGELNFSDRNYRPIDDTIRNAGTTSGTEKQDAINRAWEYAGDDAVYLPLFQPQKSWAKSKGFELSFDAAGVPQFGNVRRR